MKGVSFAARFLSVFIAASIAWGLPGAPPAFSQDRRDGDPVSIGTYRVLRSDVLDEDRLLLVSLPRGYDEGTCSYPVLYVLYGDHILGYLAEALHVLSRLSSEGAAPSMIVVGVANVSRYRDLSPVGRRGNPSGIDPFLRFVEKELIPFVESEYRTKDYRLLVGPQAGAEFGLYSMAGRPGTFNAYLIENPFMSPPAREVLMPLMEDLMVQGLPSYTFVQMACADRAGSRDQTESIEYARRFERMVAEKNPRNLVLRARYVEGSEDFIPPLLLKEGLRELFRDYRFPEEVDVRGLEDITGYYAALSERFGFEFDVPNMTLAFEADALAERGESDAAREILEYLIQKYPWSVDGYWRLANLHRELGNRETAIEYYRKCLEIMPNMPPAREWLERLEASE